MASQCEFRETCHIVPAQHIREYDRGVADETEDYFIHVKQYTPKISRPPQENDVTIIASGGIGMIKEVYEPFFQELVGQCMSKGVFIRNIWMADMGCVGKSAIINAKNLGNDPSWFDHSRDLLAMVNHFRKEMPRPLVGLGHSMGGCQIAHLSILHPRLFHTLILIEPAIWRGRTQDQALAQTRTMSRRREYWDSRSEAEKNIKENPFYKNWHPRALHLLLENSLVSTHEMSPISTPKSAHNAADAVVTTTPRSMEVGLMIRPNYRAVGVETLQNTSAQDRAVVPDIDPDAIMRYPFYRAEPITMLKLIPNVRPSVCFIVGEHSIMSTVPVRRQWLAETGMGVGGSGGSRIGKVVERVVKGGGHYPSFEMHTMSDTAVYMTEWLVSEMKRYVEVKKMNAGWREKSMEVKVKADEVMVDALADWHPKKSPDIKGLVKARL